MVVPILEMHEVMKHPHPKSRNILLQESAEAPPLDPAPSPRLSRTPAVSKVLPTPQTGQHTFEILKEFGFKTEDVVQLQQTGVIWSDVKSKL